MMSNGVELDMMHLKLSKILEVHDVMNILLEVITSLEPHVSVEIHPANRVDVDRTFCTLVICLLVHGPAIVDSERFGPTDDRSHVVKGVHNRVLGGEGGWEMIENEFGDADIFGRG